MLVYSCEEDMKQIYLGHYTQFFLFFFWGGGGGGGGGGVCRCTIKV